MPTVEQGSKRPLVLVLGAGVAGVGTALRLVKIGYRVTILEERGNVLLGSSNATPARAGHGYHYIHAETGKMYLDATIRVLREFPGCTLGYHEKDDSHFMRHGMYAIMKQKEALPAHRAQFASMFSKKDILTTYEELREHYAKKIEEDAANKLFGEPAQFFRLVDDLSPYADKIALENVDELVDTREELLDWPKLRHDLITKITINPNITVHYNMKVTGARRLPNGSFRVDALDSNREAAHFDAPLVVNCTWQNMELINQSLGIPLNPGERTLRLKTIVTFKLPDHLLETRSLFFCMGPHCMFSNMGNGKGMLTYAPETNVASTTDITLDEKYDRFLNDEASSDERDKIARRMLEGASGYIKGIESAPILHVGFGVIKSLGDADVFDPASDFHRRDYLGVVSRRLGWVDNSSMKLLYFLENADAVEKILENHEKVKLQITAFGKNLLKRGFHQTVVEMIKRKIREKLDEDPSLLGDSQKLLDSFQEMEAQALLTYRSHGLAAVSLVTGVIFFAGVCTMMGNTVSRLEEAPTFPERINNSIQSDCAYSTLDWRLLCGALFFVMIFVITFKWAKKKVGQDDKYLSPSVFQASHANQLKTPLSRSLTH